MSVNPILRLVLCTFLGLSCARAEVIFSDDFQDADGDNVSLTGTPIATGGIYDPYSGNGNVSRSNLTYSFLTGSGALNLMDYSHYAVPAAAANPSNTFEGLLTLTGEAAGGNAVEVGGNNNLPAPCRKGEFCLCVPVQDDAGYGIRVPHVRQLFARPSDEHLLSVSGR